MYIYRINSPRFFTPFFAGKSDPFVTMRTDDNVEKFRSKVLQKTLNPVWNETVTIAMPGDGEHVTLVGILNDVNNTITSAVQRS